MRRCSRCVSSSPTPGNAADNRSRDLNRWCGRSAQPGCSSPASATPTHLPPHPADPGAQVDVPDRLPTRSDQLRIRQPLQRLHIPIHPNRLHGRGHPHDPAPDPSDGRWASCSVSRTKPPGAGDARSHTHRPTHPTRPVAATLSQVADSVTPRGRDHRAGTPTHRDDKRTAPASTGAVPVGPPSGRPGDEWCPRVRSLGT